MKNVAWFRPNTVKWIIMQHMSRSVWVSSKELFEQFEKAGYQFSSFSSFNVEMSRLYTSGYLESRDDETTAYKASQYRRAEGITLSAERPKMLFRNQLEARAL